MENRFKNANEVFKYYKWVIKDHGIQFDDTQALFNVGIDFDDTKALFNIGFYIEKHMSNLITDKTREWKWDYADAEWRWYLSGDNNINKLGELYGKVPEIWKRMADKEGFVNSNYGWQWKRSSQLAEVIYKLQSNPNTRQAAISIYDAKEIYMYDNDTPCTYAVQFTIFKGKLDMCVTMRSNDLWYGFCNDQYCFSKLQELVGTETDLLIGSYYHFALNLHLYDNIIEKL